MAIISNSNNKGAFYSRKVLRSIVRNIKTNEEFRITMSKNEFNKNKSSIIVYSQTTDGEYVWNITKKFSKEVLKFIKSELYVIDANNQKEFIDTEYHIKGFRNDKWCGTRIINSESNEDFLKVAEKEKQDDVEIRIFENHKLINVL